MFFGSRISFLPRFADSVDEQLNSDDGGKGHSLPIIRIPPETWGPSYDQETGASVKPENHELIDDSCRRWTPPGRDKPCDVSATVQSYWDAAGRAVSQSFGQLPRPDTARSLPNQDAVAAFDRFFKISPGEYAAKHDLLVEIRAKFAAINSFFHGAPVHFECGTLVGKGHDPCSGSDTIASISRRMVEVCPRALEIMLNADAPPSADFGERQNFAVTLIHEIGHLVVGASNGERYQHDADFGDLTSEQASMNPESYAAFVSVTHTGGLGKRQHPKPKCQ